MDTSTFYSITADTILVAHVIFVVFVVGGLLLIYLGRFLSWGWVRNPWFRTVHLLGIGVVVLQSWFGVICPLTILEMKLRSMAGGATYSGSFVAHWLNDILYYHAPPWVFVICYTTFGGLVLLSWFLIRPRAFSEKSGIEGSDNH